MAKEPTTRVGQVRPSQLLYTYGVGALVDLPKLSVIVTGLEDWPTAPPYVRKISEPRLLEAVQSQLPSVQRLLAPPITPETEIIPNPLDEMARIGVPVAAFPRWLVCPKCQLLAPLQSGLFVLKQDEYHPDRTTYRHLSCNKGKTPEAIPARILVACEKGHLDDFPWVTFAHPAGPCANPTLRLIEYGPSGEARDLEVRCDTCDARRRLAQAFGEDGRESMPTCRARRPHLRDYDPDGCEHKMRPLVLGASNTWFPVVLSTVAIPMQSDPMAQLIEDAWGSLRDVESVGDLAFMRRRNQLGALTVYPDEVLWAAISARRGGGLSTPPTTSPNLREPEWEVLITGDAALSTDDFRLRGVPPPTAFTEQLEQIVLVERLREARAILGFTRLDSFGELYDPDLGEQTERSPLSRQATSWVPADEVHGEGLFIRFRESALRTWLNQASVQTRAAEFFEAHRRWRIAHRIASPEKGFPGLRYVLLHTLAHALMRQLALECGYTSASLRERLYAREANEIHDAMAGVLIYTSAPDSEGTLGGLVSLGEPTSLGRHIAQALEAARLCASDPLCAEHPPSRQGQTLHAAACHACLFAPETSCERGNKYLDRSVLVRTVDQDTLAFFE